jgi:hypothetical protein
VPGWRASRHGYTRLPGQPTMHWAKPNLNRLLRLYMYDNFLLAPLHAELHRTAARPRAVTGARGARCCHGGGAVRCRN